MTLTVPALPAELPPHHRPVPRILAALAAAAVVAASTLVGLASPASAEGENVVPVAVDDSYSTPMGTQLAVPGPGVIANDIDPDSTLALFSVDKVGIAGSVFVNNDGGFTYTPTAGFAGDTSFQYRVIEVGTNQFSDWATVTITVVPPAVPNALPVTVADSYTTPFETPLVVATGERLLLNDSDADGDPIVAVSNWTPSVGSLSAYGDQGTFTFTPPAGFTGDATFTYYAFDHKAQGNTVTVTITVLPGAPRPPWSRTMTPTGSSRAVSSAPSPATARSPTTRTRRARRSGSTRSGSRRERSRWRTTAPSPGRSRATSAVRRRSATTSPTEPSRATLRS